MYWILQSCLVNEPAFQDLLIQLKRQKVEYSIVEKAAFLEEITTDISIIDQNVFVCGSYSLGKAAKKLGWFPGYIDENIDMNLLLDNYKSNMLNYSSNVMKFKEVNKEILPEGDKFFIRPCLDNKSFSGMVMSWEDFKEWQIKINKLDSDGCYTTLSGEELVLVAPLTEIFSEYRFLVVDGEVVTGSQYKLGNMVIYSSNVDNEVYKYAQSMVDLWKPNRAFAIDIALTKNGYKVIEINSINSAGFYHCDMGKFVSAINNMEYYEKDDDKVI